MSVHSWAGRAALGRSASLSWRALAILTVGALLQACSAAPPLLIAGSDPSDPSAPVPAVGYRSTIGSYASQRPVAPSSWSEQNERVAPSPDR